MRDIHEFLTPSELFSLSRTSTIQNEYAVVELAYKKNDWIESRPVPVDTETSEICLYVMEFSLLFNLLSIDETIFQAE